MDGENFQYILIALTLAGSVILFFNFYTNSPFHNEKIATTWSIMISLNLWTAILLCFAKVK